MEIPATLHLLRAAPRGGGAEEGSSFNGQMLA
jgi:hypothetical protein